MSQLPAEPSIAAIAMSETPHNRSPYDLAGSDKALGPLLPSTTTNMLLQRTCGGSSVARACTRPARGHAVLNPWTGLSGHRHGSSRGHAPSAVALPKADTLDALGDEKKPEPQSARPEAGAYNWFSHWWPLSPVDYLDTKRPTKHTILGRDLVVWQQQGQWQVFQDKCPHRLAPLSQGRIINNSLQCSYHGWTFDQAGKCTNIPQVPAEQQEPSCSNKRSCATAYPIMVENNILYVWLDTTQEGLQLSKQRGVPRAPGRYKCSMGVYFNDYRGRLEQDMDPTHACYLHPDRQEGMSPDNATLMEVQQMPNVTLDEGFVMKHGGYTKQLAGVQATRVFAPPCTTLGTYRFPWGAAISYQTMVVPVQHGICRFFFGITLVPADQDQTLIIDTVAHRTAASETANHPNSTAEAATSQSTGDAGANANSKAGAQGAVAKQPSVLFSLWLKFANVRGAIQRRLPHWVRDLHGVPDQDAVIAAAQDLVMLRNGMSIKNFHMPAIQSDAGVLGINRWTIKAGYPESLFPGAKHALSDTTTLPLKLLLDRKARHVDHCVICQKGLRLMTGISIAATAITTLCGLFALTAAAMGLVRSHSLLAGGIPLLISSMLTPVLAWISVKLWEYTEERFVCGMRRWNKAGGLSLVTRA